MNMKKTIYTLVAIILLGAVLYVVTNKDSEVTRSEDDQQTVVDEERFESAGQEEEIDAHDSEVVETVPQDRNPNFIDIQHISDMDVSNPLSIFPTSLREDIENIPDQESLKSPNFNWFRIKLKEDADEIAFITELKKLDWVVSAEFGYVPVSMELPE